jgi:hypothetical protein
LFQIISLPLDYQIIDKFICGKVNALDCLPKNIDLKISLGYEWRIIYYNMLDLPLSLLTKYNFKSITVFVDPFMLPNVNTITPDGIQEHIANTLLISSYLERQTIFHATSDTTPKGFVLSGQILEQLGKLGILKMMFDEGLFPSTDILVSTPFANQETMLSTYHRSFAKDNKLDANYEEFILALYQHSTKLYHGTEWTALHGPSLLAKDNVSDNFITSGDYSIIPETTFDEKWPVVSEKTFRAIGAKHPFIIIGCAGAVSYLEKFGFNSFKELLPVPNYNEYTDNDDRLRAAIANIKAFPKILLDNEKRINDIVSENYLLLEQLAITELNTLQELLPGVSLESMFNFSKWGQDITDTEFTNNTINAHNEVNNKQWIMKYQEIKADEWPDLNNRDQFKNLPILIQNECKLDFNFSDISYLFDPQIHQKEII